ncbi:hypothetical protein EIZ48_02325 [Photobacterium alginatilyticum]|uniref:Glycosyltransferase RgtA/B/C/D-like domain-containing protein n=1 Tax=Photobacterium alginatilyticum TaxID=1775171 RepID=A0ABW9YCC8_9GAMM|nr:hypothetical protein [Photobacterium alginatilyticum]
MELTSDDALNFSRGVERFSVLEFSPHFPGYPAFIGLSRLAAIWVEPVIATVWISLLSALLIPLLIARLVYLLSGSMPAALLGSALAYMQPLLASIAISGLSDSAAMMLFMLALIAALQKKDVMTGLWIGLMLATRPSYFPLALGMLMFPLWGGYVGSRLRAYGQAGMVITVVGLLSLGFIWFHDGIAYFEEGIRFTRGHFAIWGNTVEGDSASIWQWTLALMKGFGWLGVLVVIGSLLHAVAGFITKPVKVDCQKQVALIAAIAGLYWLWITVGQNPDNLRHWAPVLFLFLVVFPVQLSRLQKVSTVSGRNVSLAGVVGIGAVTYCLLTGYQSVYDVPSKAPIQQAMGWIKLNPQVRVVGSNYSVNLLREQLGSYAIYDMYYPSSKLALVNAAKRTPQSAWRISGTRLPRQQLIAELRPRFIGERRLYLYQISQ